MLTIEQAIRSDPPHVWLTSQWGFDPDRWGCITFPDEVAQRSFLTRSEPGTLVVTYDTGKKNRKLRGRVRGFVQSTHEVGATRDLLTADAWREKQADPEMVDRWPFAVRIQRAFAVTPETAPLVARFAHETYTPGRGRVIGRFGMRLAASEAVKLLDLDFREMSIARQRAVLGAAPTPGVELLTPSKAGPVSQRAFTCRESEGPKHLYVLRLTGDPGAFLGQSVAPARIFKVGISRSPESRCAGLNSAFPSGVFRWEIWRSTFSEGLRPFPDSSAAIGVEDRLKERLATDGRSLGGEFFLAAPDQISSAWRLEVMRR